MNNRGQFSIIAALFVAIVLISTVIVTYSTIRNSQIREQPQVQAAIDETNFAIKQILGFTVGYYGSVLQVTGNSTYARILALEYLRGGLANIANMHPQWGTSYDVSNASMLTYWHMNNSYSMGSLAVNYNLTGLGVYGISYQTACELHVKIASTAVSNQARMIITKDENEAVINLGKRNIKFYRYVYANSTWEKVTTSNELTAFANGTYLIDLPSGVDPYSYVVQVEDPRGIIVVASSFSRYTCSLEWGSIDRSGISGATIVVELLQNGTMRWLGQNLQLTTQAKPIPPIPVRTIHVSQTIGVMSREVPFQIEDWNNNYQVPAGLTSNATVFGNRQMIVFLVTHSVSKVTIWWEGSDMATQTAYAFTNRYFINDDPTNGVLTNGRLRLTVTGSSWLTSVSGTMTAKADFMRINAKTPTYGSNLAYIIHHGIVRDIIHQEAEWGGGITDCPNVYSQIIITLPANVTYYTYQLHLMFVQSQQNRRITDLCPIKLTATTGLPQTENGTSGGYPIVSTASATFYNYSSSKWEHHWSQLNSSTRGVGMMFTSDANRRLYCFDAFSGSKTGAIRVDGTAKTIELLPITRFPVQFTSALDVTWTGAVVTYDGSTPIYKVQSGKGTGLWICVEYPVAVAVTTGN